MLPTTVVINLDRDTERLAHMRNLLASAGIEFTRLPAVLGAKLPDGLHKYFAERHKLSPGEIGCYASHLQICEMIADARLPTPVLVLEDDIAFAPDFAQTVRRILDALPEHWDFVRLSYPTKRATLRVAALDSRFDLVRYRQVPASTGAYLVSFSGARKFLAERKRDVAVDIDLRRVWAWGLKTYGVMPPPVLNDRLGQSSIDTISPGARRAPSMFDPIRMMWIFEAPQRHLYGLRDFGAALWVGLSAIDLIGKLAPKKQRRKLYAWASVALAGRAS